MCIIIVLTFKEFHEKKKQKPKKPAKWFGKFNGINIVFFTLNYKTGKKKQKQKNTLLQSLAN